MAHRHGHTHSHAHRHRHTLEPRFSASLQCTCFFWSGWYSTRKNRSGAYIGGELVDVVVVVFVALLFNLMLGEHQETATSYWPLLSRFSGHMTANPSHKATSCSSSLAPVSLSPPLMAIGALGEEIHPAATVHSVSLSRSRPSTLSTARRPPLPQSSPDSQCLIRLLTKHCPLTERTIMQRWQQQAPPTHLPAGRWGLGVLE